MMKNLNYQNIGKLTALIRGGSSLDVIGAKIDRFLKKYDDLKFDDRQHLVGMIVRSGLSDQFSIREEDNQKGYLRQINIVLDAAMDMIELSHFNEILAEEKSICSKKEGGTNSEFLSFLLEVVETSRYKDKQDVAA